MIISLTHHLKTKEASKDDSDYDKTMIAELKKKKNNKNLNTETNRETKIQSKF